MTPKNIMVVSKGSEDRSNWSFKLADLGISHFKGSIPARQDSTDKYLRETRTYGRQCSIEINTRCTNVLMQVHLKVTGLITCMDLKNLETRCIPRSGH